MKMLKGNSLNESRKPKNPAAKMPGFRIGTSICQKRCQRLAPKSSAASISRVSKREATTSIASKAKGKAQTKWASANDHTPIFTLITRRYHMKSPTPATMPGTISGMRNPMSSGPRRFTRGSTGPTIRAPITHAAEVAKASPIESSSGSPTRKLLP